MRKVREGYVFYDSLGSIGNTEYWTTVRSNAENYFSRVELLNQFDDTASSFLRKMGEAELEKEKKMLSGFFGVSSLEWTEDNYKEIIEAINQVLNIEKVYKRAISKIKVDEKEENSRDVAIASTYGEYVTKKMNRALPAFFSRKKVIDYINNGRTQELGYEFEQMIEKVLNESLESMLSSESKTMGNDKIWEGALDAINDIDNFRQSFGQEFFSRYGFDRLQDKVKTAVADGVDVKGLKDQIVTEYKGKFSHKQKGQLHNQSIAGFVSEHVAQLLQGAASSFAGKPQVSTIAKHPMFTTDIISLMDYQYDGTIEIDSTNIRSKRDAQRALIEFHRNVLSNLDDVTVTYTNVKKYNLGKSFKGFSGGTRRLEDIDLILEQIGYTKTHSFINMIKNTASGALLQHSNKQQLASETLATAVAYFLFDDLETIGNASSGANAIHMFHLSDVVLPLSFLLLQMAEALEEAARDLNSFVKVSFKLPSVQFEYPQSNTSRVASNERWEQQKVSMQQQAQVQVTFLKNFKKLIKRFL